MKFHTKWRKFLTEGGNVFKGERVDSIPLAFIQPTLEQYYEELSNLFHSTPLSLLNLLLWALSARKQSLATLI